MQNFYWYVICALKAIFCRLPHKTAVRLGDLLGRVMWLVCKSRVDKAEVRCVRALGVGVTPARRIVLASYRNIGRAVAETLRLPKIAATVERYVALQGEENLRQALARGRGVILLLGHLDNWEIANICVSKKYPLNVVAANQRDQRITDLLMKLRSLAGSRNVQKGQGLKGAIRCLRNGEVLCVLHDQDAKERGLVVPFLGLPASTPTGVAKLAAKFGAAVVPTHIVREPDGFTHRVIFETALAELSGAVFGENEESCLKMCNDRISSWIRERPGQWLLWLYPRWASTVPGDR
ncbi:lysophospholipid acyltransferase family protein [Pyramidobacter sp. SM-530-WT-4B]|uniref:Lysophospholipid acyltransferase family protein n=1 Tax=Pyramidobacter porci TaxID=2605789 RepID=A0A6L5Y8P3_9BACT|nr:lysophospholipid acyltransferase family protein [Pyramidobacter porci]MST54553.1 lysophospholipid acyltransferase family protein [Pyramidobacter porci]